MNTVYSNLKTKQGSIWYLGKFERICVDFPITMIQVNLSKAKNKWIGTLLYNELFIKQETPIYHQTSNKKNMFIVGDI